MPTLPARFSTRRDTGNGLERLDSREDDKAFNFHPGVEVEYARGERVPSEILDRKLGVGVEERSVGE